MADVVGARLQRFNTPGSLGVVKDTRYIRCFWPLLDVPFSPFAQGSSGIVVEGPPTPRNILFPPDTVFLNGTRGDCFFEAQAVEDDVPKNIRMREVVNIRGVNREVEYLDVQAVREPVRRVTPLTRAEAEAKANG
jgi:hypothetical protein